MDSSPSTGQSTTPAEATPTTTIEPAPAATNAEGLTPKPAALPVASAPAPATASSTPVAVPTVTAAAPAPAVAVGAPIAASTPGVTLPSAATAAVAAAKPFRLKALLHQIRVPDLEGLLGLVFIIGFASIFIINSINAFYVPADFTKLLAANPITRAIGHYEVMVKITVCNDLLLGILILSRWKKKYVWAWAGSWLILVAGIKGLYLISK